MSEKPLLLRRDDMLEPAQRIREMQEQSPDYHVHACESVVAMQEQIFDDSAYSAGADTLVRIMCEFWDDGEVFQPSVDDELAEFLVDAVLREAPDLDADDLEELFSHLKDFPPVEVIADIRAREQLALVA